jgi:5-(carboxyamino)imidazole ribonucleotide mutase
MNRADLDPQRALVAIVMGSKSDAEIMRSCKQVLDVLEIPCEARVLSAHRTPDEMSSWAKNAVNQGVEVLIAGAGASAALPGAVAAHTLLPVIGVPLNATSLHGMDALLAIAQMPFGVPVATMAIGEPGAKNAALMAARILALKYPHIEARLKRYAQKVYETARENSLVDAFL